MDGILPRDRDTEEPPRGAGQEQLRWDRQPVHRAGRRRVRAGATAALGQAQAPACHRGRPRVLVLRERPGQRTPRSKPPSTPCEGSWTTPMRRRPWCPSRRSWPNRWLPCKRACRRNPCCMRLPRTCATRSNFCRRRPKPDRKGRAKRGPTPTDLGEVEDSNSSRVVQRKKPAAPATVTPAEGRITKAKAWNLRDRPEFDACIERMREVGSASQTPLKDLLDDLVIPLKDEVDGRPPLHRRRAPAAGHGGRQDQPRVGPGPLGSNCSNTAASKFACARSTCATSNSWRRS